MSGGPVYVPSQRQDPHGDADAMRAYARKLRSMATRLETISNASDSTVYFYSYDWKGAARDNFITLWNSSITATDCLSSTARGTLYRQYQADRRDAIREHPETARMWNAERYEGPGKTAFRVAIDACNDLARYLDDFAHVIDEEHAQDDKFALDVVIIVVSVVAAAATISALGPEMALLDVALLGAAIGGATAGAINFTNQMVDNMEVGHQGFVEAFMGVDTDELGKAIITGEIVGAVSTFAGAGLGQVFSGAPAAGRIAISALGFGGGTFVGDAGAQALLNDGHRVDWSQAAVDGLTATAFAGAFGTVLHVAGGATPAGKPTMTVRNAGDEFEVTFQSDTSMPVMRNGQPIGNARFETVELDGVTHTSLVIDEGGVRIPLQGKNVMLSNGVAHVEVTVGPEGPQAISTRLISDGSLIVQPAPGERGMPAAMLDEGGGVTVPKDWAVTRFSDGTVTLDPRSPNANTITFRTSGTSAELVIKTPDLESSLGVVRGGDGASLLGEGAPELPRTGSDISPFVKGGDGAFLDTALRTDAGEGLVTTADGQRFANLKLPETPGAGFEAPETAAASAAGDGAIGDLGPGLPESGGAGAIGDVRPVLPESGGAGALEVPRGVATGAGPFNPTPVQPASGPVPQTQVGTRGVDLQVLDRPTTDAGAGEDVLPPGERLTDLTLDDMLNGRWDAPEGPVSENLLTTPDLVVPPSVSTATPIEPGVVSPAMPVPPVAPTPPPVVPPRAVAPAVFNAGLSALPRPAPFTPVSSLTVPSTLPLEMPAPSPVPEISPVQPLTVPRPVTGTQIIPPATFVPRPVPLTVPPLGAPMPAGPMPAPATPMPLPVAPNPLPAGPTTPVGPTPLPVRPAPLPAEPTPLPTGPTPLPTGPTPLPTGPTPEPTGPTPEPTGPTTTPGPGSSPRPAPGPTPLPTTPGTAPQPAPVPGRPAMPVPGIPPSVTPVPGLLPPAGPVEPPPVEVPLVRPVELPPPPAAPEVTQPRILSWTPEIPVEVPDRPAGALVDPTPIKPRPASPAWVPDIQASAAAGAPEPRIHVVEGLVLPEDAARPETAAAQVPLRIAMLPTLGMPLPPVHYGGNARVINDLTNELVRRGHAVTLFAAENSVTPAQLHPVVPRAFTEMDMAAENPRTVLMGDPWEIGRNGTTAARSSRPRSGWTSST